MGCAAKAAQPLTIISLRAFGAFRPAAEPQLTPHQSTSAWPNPYLGNSSFPTRPRSTPRRRRGQVSLRDYIYPTIALESEASFTQFLTGPASKNHTNSMRRHWESTTLTATCWRLHHTHPRSAACAICAARRGATCPHCFLTASLDTPQRAALRNHGQRFPRRSS